MTLLYKIITTGNRCCYRITNTDGKSWLLPAKNMRVALNLYQPSGRNGKLLKALFPWLHRLPFVRKAIKAKSIRCALRKELNERLCNIFGVKDIEFAIFEGTPCVHQKITMQLSCGKRILGYCKASDNNDIRLLFEKETAMLQQLARKGVTGIPKALFCGTLSNGVHIFVQSTAKTTNSQIAHEWSILQENFLAQLYKKTKQQLLFEESDYNHSIIALQEHLDWLPANIDRMVVATAIAGVMAKYRGKTVEFSAYHGDFTPWNMFVEKERLFVFDFEYAALAYPPMFDKIHFALQTAIFEKKLQKEEIVTELPRDFDKERIVMYLLDIIARFTLRENGPVNGDTRLFDIWGYLLKEISISQTPTKE